MFLDQTRDRDAFGLAPSASGRGLFAMMVLRGITVWPSYEDLSP